MIEVLKQAYQLLLTEPHAPTVCDQLEVIFRRAIAELESQEPVAWVCCGSGEKHDIDFYEDDVNALPVGTMLYIHPPQRTWVGLTNEELTDLFYNTNLGQQSAVSQAVALLKERNS
jgi:hypothetical protein